MNWESKTKQYARIVFGVLMVEDIVVILLMVLLSTIDEETLLILSLDLCLGMVVLATQVGSVSFSVITRAKKTVTESHDR